MNPSRPLYLLPVLLPLLSGCESGEASHGDPDHAWRAAVLAEDAPVDDDTLTQIQQALPENVSAPEARPELFEGFTPTLQALEDTEVWVTFVHDGASYKNAFGYFTYPADQPPSEALSAEELAEGLIFNNASALFSGGKLYNGRRMYLGVLPTGYAIGFYLITNGYCTAGESCDLEHNVNFERTTYYTLDALNPEQLGEHRRHVVLAGLDQPDDARLLAWEDLNRDNPGTDDDFNDLVFRVTATPELLGDPGEPFLGAPEQGADLCLFYSGPNDDPEGTTHAICYAGDGSGGWDPSARRDSPVDSDNFSGYRFELADIDGDGADDFVATSATPSALYQATWRSDGQGGFIPGRMVEGIVHEWGNWTGGDFQYGDVDGDGDDDLCVIESVAPGASHAHCWLSEGDGSFTTIGWSDLDPVPSDTHFGFPDLVDVNGDGAEDMCQVRINGGGVWALCYESDGQGGFSAAPMNPEAHTTNLAPAPWGDFHQPTFGDIDGDGQADLCLLYNYLANGTAVAQSHCFIGDGAGGFGPRQDMLHEEAWGLQNYQRKGLVDVDLDGDDDLCLTSNTQTSVLAICYESDNGTWLPGRMQPASLVQNGGFGAYTQHRLGEVAL